MKKVLSLLLSAALVLGLAFPGVLSAPVTAAETGSGMMVNKTAVYDENSDQYTITLEAYATGSKVITEVKKDVPTDIILVLDQSGSMSNAMGTVSYSQYTGSNRSNSNLYSKRHNGGEANLWYKLADGSYASVSVTKTITYTALSTNLVNYESNWGELTTNCYFYYENNLYEKVGDEYKKVTLSQSGNRWDGYTYTYTFSDGTTVTSSGRDSVPNLGSHAPLYTPAADNNNTVYTYSYTDSTGAMHVIGTGTGASNNFTTAALYQRNVSSSGGGSRLSALTNAVTNFANAVAEKAAGLDGNISTTDDNINHRIAMVGFSGTSRNYSNTEIFVGSTEYNYTNASSHYKEAFQSMDTENGKNNVLASIQKLTADGSTYIHHGMELANGIFDANPVKQGETRNRVIIVFTDGVPGYSTSWYNDSKATGESAMDEAEIAKKNGATVYAVGIMAGADPTIAGNWDNSASENEKVNYFMQNLSSNNGVVQSPSYYLSASDSESLNAIFQQISSNIESGGSATELSEETVIRDIIAPQFQLPEGATAADITLETYACTGVGGNGAYTWSKNDTAMGATATINAANGNVNVTGFDFSDNYVGTVTNTDGTVSYRGNKLVIRFKVTAKDGFLGGNDVYTNSSAGVYENANATQPVVTFPRPTVNVPIENVTVDAADKNVYLLGGLTAEQIKAGATVKCGDVELKLDQNNYGLQSWQTDYVDITVSYTYANGNPLSAISSLKNDTTYTITVTITPKTQTPVSAQGEVAVTKTGSDSGNIHVFKPVLTFADSTVYYGDTAPDDFSGNKTSEVWKHGDTLDSAVTMIGTKPTLALTYKPETGKIVDSKIATKSDFAVDVTVKIGQTDVGTYTSFQHTNCQGKTCGMPTNGKFWLHVKTCQLTITKAAGTNTTIGSDEYFVFNIKKDGSLYTQASIAGTGSVTIYELPVGTYTVEEDTESAWRYSASMDKTQATLSATHSSDTITCTNTKNNDQWLNHFTRVINTYGAANGSQD